MDLEQTQKRLEVTQRQIGLLEKCIANAQKNKDQFHPKIYEAMVRGYESLRQELQAETVKYQKELGLE